MNQQKSFMDNFFLKKIIQQKKKEKLRQRSQRFQLTSIADEQSAAAAPPATPGSVVTDAGHVWAMHPRPPCGVSDAGLPPSLLAAIAPHLLSAHVAGCQQEDGRRKRIQQREERGSGKEKRKGED